MLVLSLSALVACGIDRPRVVLGDAGAFGDLVRGLGLENRQQTHLMRLFEAHGSALADHLPPEGARAALTSLDGDLALADTLARLDAGGLVITGGRTAEDIAARLADRAGRASAEAIPAKARSAIAAFALRASLTDASLMLERFFTAHGVSRAPDRLAALAAELARAGRAKTSSSSMPGCMRRSAITPRSNSASTTTPGAPSPAAAATTRSSANSAGRRRLRRRRRALPRRHCGGPRMTALFAIPSKGRLKEDCFALLERAGLKVAPPPGARL